MANAEDVKSAIIRGDLGALKTLKEDGAFNVDHDLSSGYTAISRAVPLVKVLYPSQRDNIGYRAMHWAARHNRIEIIKYLYDQGADPNSRNYIGNTPLHIALYYGQAEAIDTFIEYCKAKVDLEVENTGSKTLGVRERFRPLHYALIYGSKADCVKLIEKNVDVNATGMGGATPLHLSVYKNDVELLQLLKSKGAKFDAVDEKGLSILDYALLSDTVGLLVVNFLLQHGIKNPDESSFKQLTARTEHIEKQQLRAHKILLLVINQVELPKAISEVGLVEFILMNENYDLFNKLMKEMVQLSLTHANTLYQQLGLTPTVTIQPLTAMTSARSEEVKAASSSMTPALFKPESGERSANDASTVASSPPPPPPPPPPINAPVNTIFTIRREPKQPRRESVSQPTGLDIMSLLKSNPRFQSILAANQDLHENDAAREDINKNITQSSP